MPQFSYTARNETGAAITGVLDAQDMATVADVLRNRGLTPLDIQPRVVGGGINLQSMGLARHQVGLVDIMLFSRQMHTLLKAGVPILRALAGLRESTPNPAFARVVAELSEKLDSGRELSMALQEAGHFSPFYINMVRVGEMTGMLDTVFLRLFHYLDFEKNTRERTKAAMRYPTMVLLAMGAAMGIINVLVIPAFAKVYASARVELPLLTRVLIAISDFSVRFWPLILLLLAAAVIGARLYVRTPTGRFLWDRWKLRIPIIGSILEKATLARFARSFALASKSGIPIVQALGAVSAVVDNRHIGSRLEEMRNAIERGESIVRSAAATRVFTPIVLQMIAVGEETGELDSLLEEVAQMYEREVEYEVAGLSEKIEPILIIILAAMVLVMALGVFLPIWDLGQTLIHGNKK